jgi:hypothetical protein
MPGGPEDQEFSDPPESGRNTISSGEEEASQQFDTPTESEVEAVAVSPAAEVLAGVPSALLQMKGVIEEYLVRQAAQAAGVSAMDSFADAGNIQGIAVGLGDEGDVVTAADPGSPTLTVYVAEPTTTDRVRSVVVDSLGVQAATVDEVPLTVVVTGVIDAQPHRFRIRPAPGGVSVGHFAITAGTIGCLARGCSAPRNNRLLMLSNNHVLANVNNGKYGDCIAQPGPFDGGKCPADRIAILERFIPINFSGGPNFVDCATGWCWPNLVRRELIFLSGGQQRFFRIGSVPVAPALGMAVGKSGRTTQLTNGRITGVGATVNVNYGGGRVANFRDQIAIRASSGDFSAGGDSGSSIWTFDSARRPVGLLFAGGGGITFANRMDRVVAALDIVLFT